MIDNGSKNIPITREMIVEKVDAEFQAFHESVPDNQQDNSFIEKRDVLAQIRNALYAMPIPDEFFQSIYERDSILTEVYLFWVGGVSAGEPNADRLSLAYDCTSNWINGVRHEYKSTLLREKLAVEHEAFIAEERKKLPDEIIEDAWKITCMNDLLMAFENEDLDSQSVDALLTLEYPLHTVYAKFLSKDSESRMYDLVDTAIEVAQTRHNDLVTENAYSLPEESAVKQHIDEYVKTYGGVHSTDEQDIELEP